MNVPAGTGLLVFALTTFVGLVVVFAGLCIRTIGQTYCSGHLGQHSQTFYTHNSKGQISGSYTIAVTDCRDAANNIIAWSTAAVPPETQSYGAGLELIGGYVVAGGAAFLVVCLVVSCCGWCCSDRAPEREAPPPPQECVEMAMA